MRETTQQALLQGDYTNHLLAARRLSNLARVPADTIMATDNRIPLEIARQLRALAHDLSNSLETILQATYLVSQTDLPANTRRWVEMMDQASQEAVALNRTLREILRSQS